MRARWLVVGLIWAGACAHSASQTITQQYSAPHFGDILPDCEIQGTTFLVRVSASCVVDTNKRAVISNVATGATLIDTSDTGQVLPNFPTDGGSITFELPCQVEECKTLEDEKHELIVDVTGDCGSEHAAGSEHCKTGP